jgi:hypothetical protein
MQINCSDSIYRCHTVYFDYGTASLLWESLNPAGDDLFHGDFTRDQVIAFLLPRRYVVPVTEVAEERGLTVCQKVKTVLFLVEVKSLVSTQNFFFLILGCDVLLRKLSKDSLYSFSRIA